MRLMQNSKTEEKMVGDILILEGKTLKGKNRVREHGNRWKVIQEAATVRLIVSLESPDPKIHDMRWVAVFCDKNFLITEEK